MKLSTFVSVLSLSWVVSLPCASAGPENGHVGVAQASALVETANRQSGSVLARSAGPVAAPAAVRGQTHSRGKRSPASSGRGGSGGSKGGGKNKGKTKGKEEEEEQEDPLAEDPDDRSTAPFAFLYIGSQAYAPRDNNELGTVTVVQRSDFWQDPRWVDQTLELHFYTRNITWEYNAATQANSTFPRLACVCRAGPACSCLPIDQRKKLESWLGSGKYGLYNNGQAIIKDWDNIRTVFYNGTLSSASVSNSASLAIASSVWVTAISALAVALSIVG